MIYQAVLCVVQSGIIIFVFMRMNVKMPDKSLITDWPLVDIGITLFLITYCADMLALLISAVARTTTSAMTIMPFILIVQLLFSGSFFSLPEKAMPFTNLTATKWGLTALCAQGDYNSLPMVSVWNNALKMKNVEINNQKPLLDLFKYVEDNNMRDDILMMTAKENQIEDYAFSREVIYNAWKWLIMWTIIYVFVATLLLEFIDKDNR
jgi:hypothetical protein